MATDDEWWQRPQFLLPAGVVAALVLWAVGLLLHYALPALGAALGFIAAGVIHGAVTAVAAAPWTVPVSMAGGAVVVAGSSVLVLVRVVQQVAAKPFAPVTAILAVSQTFLLDLVKEFSAMEPLQKLAYKATAALMFLAAAALWKRRGRGSRTAAVLLFLLEPAMVVLRAGYPFAGRGFAATLTTVAVDTWMALGTLAMTVAVILLLGTYVGKTEEEGA